MDSVYICPFCGEAQVKPLCYKHPPLKVSWIYKISDLTEIFEISMATPDFYQITLQFYARKTYLYFNEDLIAETDLLPINPNNYKDYRRRLINMKAFL